MAPQLEHSYVQMDNRLGNDVLLELLKAFFNNYNGKIIIKKYYNENIID